MQKIVMSWRVFPNPVGLCSMKVIQFASMKVIHLDVNKENTIISRPFIKLSINIAKFC